MDEPFGCDSDRLSAMDRKYCCRCCQVDASRGGVRRGLPLSSLTLHISGVCGHPSRRRRGAMFPASASDLLRQQGPFL
jgi:hypothetical protein